MKSENLSAYYKETLIIAKSAVVIVSQGYDYTVECPLWCDLNAPSAIIRCVLIT